MTIYRTTGDNLDPQDLNNLVHELTAECKGLKAKNEALEAENMRLEDECDQLRTQLELAGFAAPVMPQRVITVKVAPRARGRIEDVVRRVIAEAARGRLQ